MFRSFKILKLLCVLLSLIMVMNSTMIVFSKENKNKEIQEILYDGITYIVETKPNKLTITAEGHDVYFELKENGKAMLKGKAVKGLGKNESYDMTIKNLYEDIIDMDIYKNGQFMQSINNYDDLGLDEYEGQGAITFTIIGLSTLIKIVVAAVATIVVANITYIAVDKIIEKLRKDTPYDTFSAIISGRGIFINPLAITYTQAVSRIRSGLSTYSFMSSSAYNVVNGTGLGVIGSEIDVVKKSGYIYFYHYHTSNRNGSHAWFGLPYFG